MRLLLERHANQNVRDRMMATESPLILAIAVSRSENIAGMLVKARADINAKDDFGHTAKFYARQTGNERLLKIVGTSVTRQ